MPKGHAYTLEPGRPTPGRHNLLRPPIASYEGIGLLTDFPSATRFRLTLGADSPCADERCAGNLGLSASRPFTCFIATHVSIRTSDTSSKGSPSPSQVYGTLSYHTRNPLSTLSRTTRLWESLWPRPAAISRRLTSHSEVSLVQARTLEHTQVDCAHPRLRLLAYSPVTSSAQDDSTSELLRFL